MSSNTVIISGYTIGADIECFVKNVNTNEIVSAEGFVKGTKNVPFFFDEKNPFFATSLDNVLAEICIPPVKANDCKGFVSNINKSFGYVSSTLPKHLCTAHVPAASLDSKWLQTENAKLFGCEPDYNVWERSVNQKPKAENENLRSSGFHVHVGYDEPENEKTEKCIKAMDLFLSVPSILIEPDNERRKLYGKAGAFRFKPYGFEHRVLSGFFASSDDLKAWVFNNTEKAIEAVNNGLSDEIESVSAQIQMAINKADVKIAGNLIRQFDIPMN